MITIARDDVVRPLGAVEDFAFGIHPPSNRRLVLLHARRCEAVEGTAAHLSGRDVFMHHHVALHDEDDVESLARFLTGRAIEFVAGGGGGYSGRLPWEFFRLLKSTASNSIFLVGQASAPQ